MLNCFPILCSALVRTDLNAGSTDGVEVFVESTVTYNYVEDGSVAHLVLDIVALKLVDSPDSNESSLDPMVESVWTGLFLIH